MAQSLHTYTATKQLDFCYGHRLLNYAGNCRFLHGHNGRVEIDIVSDALDERGMVIDFSQVKSVAKKWIDENLDHRMILNRMDPLLPYLTKTEEPVFVVNENPTCEVIAETILDNITRLGVNASCVRLWETPSSVASVWNSALMRPDAGPLAARVVVIRLGLCSRHPAHAVSPNGKCDARPFIVRQCERTLRAPSVGGRRKRVPSVVVAATGAARRAALRFDGPPLGASRRGRCRRNRLDGRRSADGIRPQQSLAVVCEPLVAGGGQVPDAQTCDEAVHLPGRNAFLISTAAVLCETEKIAHIVHGTLGSNPFLDASPTFFSLIGQVVSCSLGRNVVIETPLKTATKRDVIRSTPPEIAKLTFSCIDPVQGLHCGRCNKCAERRNAFIDAGCDDPTSYAAR